MTDIGIEPNTDDADALWNDPVLWREYLTEWPRETHKYQRGHVTIIGGPGLKGGAGRLAALAAASTGAGAVTVLSPLNAATFAASRLDAVMVGTVPDTEHLAGALQERRSSVVVGPGMGHSEAAAKRLDAVLAAKVPVVVDADALTLHEQTPTHLFDRLHPSCVLTPHEGEFRRLFPDLEGNKLMRATAAAERCGATVLLKGATTVIATPGELPVIDTTGSPALATAGSGDSLAGAIAAALAQGHPPHRAASIAAWLHGKAGEGAGLSLMADDLAARIGHAFDDVTASRES
ncbi:MAG: NAD(P)H-hydrate dehydratase [Parvularculaceae bacterium]|nr:NAD(P)H-hydrate dehydratase [Parvularculaceae bacterium]